MHESLDGFESVYETLMSHSQLSAYFPMAACCAASDPNVIGHMKLTPVACRCHAHVLSLLLREAAKAAEDMDIGATL